MWVKNRQLIQSVIYGSIISFATLAHAQTGTSSSSSSGAVAPQTEPQDVERYWSPQRLRDAKPIELHPRAVGPDGLPEGAQTVTPNRVRGESAASERGEGAPPSVKLERSLGKQLVPGDMQQGMFAEGENVQPEATSSFGALFTTTRVFPDTATTTYPYSATGKLFFSDPHGGSFVCSASVLRPRIIVTAGHCVTHPSTDAAQRYFYTNFLFVPAYNGGAAPFGSWTSSQQWVANAWYFSNGSVPNEQDVAMLIANDRVVNGQPQKLGAITGYIGYVTNALASNNVTMLGYPCNLDSCARMEMTNAQTFASGGSNTFVYGSAMRGGESGGNWVQDFGVNPASNPAVTLGLNYLVAVTSYGPVATEPKYLGASNLDARFLDVLNHACGAHVGNCP